jgi:hypothetical protein
MSGTPSLFPEELIPQEDVEVVLGRGRKASLHRYRVDFNPCHERPTIALDRAYSAKPLVLVEKQPAFPEIALLGLFLRNGWEGAWVDLSHRKFFDRMPNLSKGISLSTYPNQVVARIAENNEKSREGFWDLILWRERTVAFIAVVDRESGLGLSEGHMRWLNAALRAGVSPNQFVVIEWGNRRVAVRRSRSRP